MSTSKKLSFPIVAFVTLYALLSLVFVIKVVLAAQSSANGTFDDHDVSYSLRVWNAR